MVARALTPSTRGVVDAPALQVVIIRAPDYMMNTHSPAATFVLDALRQNSAATFAEVKARAAMEGLTLQPLTYGRARKALGLIAPRATPKDGTDVEESKQEVKDLAAWNESAENGAPEAVAETETVVGPELQLEPAPMPPPKNSHDGSSAPAPRRRQVRAQTSSTASPIEQLLAHVRQLEDENRRYREAIERIRQVVEGWG